MTLIVSMLVVIAAALAAGWTGLENAALGIPVVLGLTWAAARLRRSLHSRAGSGEYPELAYEDPPARRMVAGLVWGALLSLVLALAFHVAARVPLYRAVADLHGRQILSDIETLERLHEWNAIVKRLSGPLPRRLSPDARRILIEKKMNALIRGGESNSNAIAACGQFREAKELGLAEGLDTSLAIARLDVCAERSRRRSLPPGSRAEILRIERDNAGGMAMIGVQLTDGANRPIVGLEPTDFGAAVDGRPVSVVRADVIDKLPARGRRLAIVVDLAAPERIQLLASAALVAGSLAEGDAAELIFCGESAVRASAPAGDRLALLKMLFRAGAAPACSLPEAIALAAAGLHGQAREALLIFAADHPIPDATAALLAECGSPVFVVQMGSSAGELRRLVDNGGQLFLTDSVADRASFEARFRNSRPDSSTRYRLIVAAALAPGTRISVTVGGENAVNAAAHFQER